MTDVHSSPCCHRAECRDLKLQNTWKIKNYETCDTSPKGNRAFQAARDLDTAVRNKKQNRVVGRQVLMVFRLPIITVSQMVCLSHGGNPGTQEKNNQAADLDDTRSCTTVMAEHYDAAERKLLALFGSIGVGEPHRRSMMMTRRLGGRMGLGGAYTGAAVTYSVTNKVLTVSRRPPFHRCATHHTHPVL